MPCVLRVIYGCLLFIIRSFDIIAFCYSEIALDSSDIMESSKSAGRLILNKLDAIVIDEVDSLLSMSRKDELHHRQLVSLSRTHVMMKLDASSQDHVELLLQHLGVNDQAQQEPQDKEISRIQGLHLQGSLMFTSNGFASEI